MLLLLNLLLEVVLVLQGVDLDLYEMRKRKKMELIEWVLLLLKVELDLLRKVLLYGRIKKVLNPKLLVLLVFQYKLYPINLVIRNKNNIKKVKVNKS